MPVSLKDTGVLFGGTAPHGLKELYGETFSDGGSAPASGSINLRAFEGKSPARFGVERAKLIASDGQSSDRFGSSADVDGDTIVVGANGNDDAGESSGSAYVFTRNTAGSLTSGWTQRVKLTASDHAAFDYFGGLDRRDGVSIDGDTVVIGATGNDRKTRPTGKVGGSAYVFTRNTAGSLTSGWTQRAKLIASDVTAYDNFGSSVSIDGDTLVIGAYGLNTYRGAAYVFRRNTPGSLTSGWTQVTKLTASDGAANDFFGLTLSISGDTVAIGARNDDDNNASNSGSAYIFTRDTSGSLTSGWTQRAKLTANDAGGSDKFGESVSIDGDAAVIGAPGDNDAGADSGSAYIFTRDTSGSLTSGWTQVAKMTAGDGAAGDEFGYHVAIEGGTVVIGAIFKYVNNQFAIGSAYVFTRDAVGNWTQTTKLLASDGTASQSPNFGDTVSISGDTVVIAAMQDDLHTGTTYATGKPNSGATYVFTLEINPIN